MTPSPTDGTSPAVIVYGTVCLDHLVRVNQDFVPLGPPQEMPGGEAFNTASALVGWGLPVLLTGTALGPGADSDRLRRLLDDPSIGLSRRHIPELPNAVTPVCTIRVTPDGERVMQGRGYAEAVAPPPLPESEFVNRPVFSACPNLGHAAVAESLRAASLGCRVVAMDFQQYPAVCRAAYLVQTSRESLTRFPLPAGAADSLEQAAETLVALGAERVVITDGARGGTTAERHKEGGIDLQRFPAAPVEVVVDTTGAGDVFRAGLCWGLLQNPDLWPLARLVRVASAAAALHMQTFGSCSRPPLDAVLRLADSMP
ncbi:MAG: carbohydrate kinase family protein [Armatimonadota bacterium]